MVEAAMPLKRSPASQSLGGGRWGPGFSPMVGAEAEMALPIGLLLPTRAGQGNPGFNPRFQSGSGAKLCRGLLK